jgi:hypothetical protein
MDVITVMAGITGQGFLTVAESYHHQLGQCRT